MKLHGKSILVLPDENPETTNGGIEIPKTVKDKPSEGIIIDCGPGCETVKPGKKIIYHRKGASVIILDEREHHFIIEDQVRYVYQ